MDDLARFCCLNSECPDRGVRGGENLSVCGHYGKAAPIRFLRCRSCGHRFSERKGTPLFHSHLTKEKAVAVMEHVADGCGVRQTGRLVGVHRDTVTRYTRKAGGHAEAAHDELAAFSPLTAEVQFDEKWSYVAKKEAECDRSDPADDHKGSYWDHVAFDPEHRLVIAVVPGARDVEGTEELVGQFRRRTEGRTMRLMTSDSYPAYAAAILDAYGATVTPPRTGKPGRPKGAYKSPPADLVYATVEKVRKKGRVVEVLTRVVFGTTAAVAAALAGSRVSRSVNTSFIERQNATDRHRNARKSRKTYRFSKDWRSHEAATYFTMYSSNFCWPVRTLREPTKGGWRRRTPAMSAGLTDHVWSMTEWISLPIVLRI